MWRFFGLLCFLSLSSRSLASHLATMVSVNPSATSLAASTSSQSSTNTWHMNAVTSVQARVQGDHPIWNKKAQIWQSKFGDTTPLAYMNNLDTVDTASVDGVLMFPQAEGINVNEQSVTCERKNKMQYVVFYEVTILQPTYGIKYYEDHTPPEYGDFVAMDGGKCTDVGDDLPEDCKVYYGLDGEMEIGPMVGCSLQTSDPRAIYPDNFWFSYPNSCAHQLREDKTEECRAQYPGGLCPMGVEPDGDNCTFSYKILGYLNLDDLVGITAMGYKNYKEFCEDGGVEFKATNTGSGFDVEESIDFWLNPGDEDANTNRTNIMVEMYNNLASSSKSPNMEPLPSVEKLIAANPKCYKNSAACATSQYGCSRTGYAQVCSVCESTGDGCEVAPSTFSFPDLTLPSDLPLGFSDSLMDGDSTQTVYIRDRDQAASSSSSNPATSNALTATMAPGIVAFVVLVVSSLV